MASLPAPQRASPRHAIDAEVSLAQDGRILARGRTRNLSAGGLCAVMSSAVPRGAEVEVAIALVFVADGLSEPLRLPARVVWCTGFDDGDQVGLAFLRLTRQQSTYLDMFVRFLVGGRPPDAAVVLDPFDDD